MIYAAKLMQKLHPIDQLNAIRPFLTKPDPRPSPHADNPSVTSFKGSLCDDLPFKVAPTISTLKPHYGPLMGLYVDLLSN